jgi:O-acetyl-ADP-ribose deacetylase (regulator of RNase III)
LQCDRLTPEPGIFVSPGHYNQSLPKYQLFGEIKFAERDFFGILWALVVSHSHLIPLTVCPVHQVPNKVQPKPVNTKKRTKSQSDLNKRVAILDLRMIELQKGDITKMKVDAIVNAANMSLLGGGGVDGAIHRAGGKAILEECQKIRAKQGGCKTGEAVITTGGKLPAKYVIHAVGPVWHGGKIDEERLLASAYTNSLAIALENEVRSIAFPNISTGVYGFPKDKAAKIAIDVVNDFLNSTDQVDKVIFVCYDDENYKLYKELLNQGNNMFQH